MRPAEPALLLDLSEVGRRYGSGDSEVVALSEVSLRLRAGEFVAIIGESGSGKTTLLNIIGGLDRPTEGTATVLGIDAGSASLATLADLRLRSIGYVFQNVNLLPDLTLTENVALPMQAAGVRRAIARHAAVLQLERVGLSRLGSRYPAQASGGERQRAAIARATVGSRQILLADEPTGALDSASGGAVIEVIRDLCGAGVGAVVSTHNPQVAAAADRVVSLQDGHMVSMAARST